MRNALAELLKSVVCISCCAGTCLLGYCHGYDGSFPMALLIFAVSALGLICARIGSLTLEKKDRKTKPENGIAPSNLREEDVTLDTTRLAPQARSPCDRWRNQASSQG